ncbi:hypothetical protein B566_EDAN010830 [Ephemera danica]|nr:hypothetical protein B566_EDAN010830 [Ephemera danica]
MDAASDPSFTPAPESRPPWPACRSGNILYQLVLIPHGLVEQQLVEFLQQLRVPVQSQQRRIRVQVERCLQFALSPRGYGAVTAGRLNATHLNSVPRRELTTLASSPGITASISRCTLEAGRMSSFTRPESRHRATRTSMKLCELCGLTLMARPTPSCDVELLPRTWAVDITRSNKAVRGAGRGMLASVLPHWQRTTAVAATAGAW